MRSTLFVMSLTVLLATWVSSVAAAVPALELSVHGSDLQAWPNRSGYGITAGVSAGLLPWLRAGGELGWTRFGKPSGYSMLTSPDGLGPLDSAGMVSLIGVFRLSPPVTSGVAPVLLTGTGVSVLRPGIRSLDWAVGGMEPVDDPDEWGLCSVFGLGLRGQWGARARGFELSVRWTNHWADDARHTTSGQVGVVF